MVRGQVKRYVPIQVNNRMTTWNSKTYTEPNQTEHVLTQRKQ